MAQLFPPCANRVGLAAVLAVVSFLVLAPFAVWAFARSPAATGQFHTSPQPIPFSHPLHANGLGINCEYCHAGVQRAAMAGLPPTAACVPCHQPVTLNSNLFAPVRRSLSSGRPIAWRRITSLPDFVFFNHAVHVRNGVACGTCHGPVNLMEQVYQAAPLTMEWCVQCHSAPERYISVRETRVSGVMRGDPARGRVIAARYDIARLTSCTTCHR